MKKQILTSVLVAMVASLPAITLAEGNIEVNTLDVTSTNTITGDVTATEGGTISVGDTEITGSVKAETIKASTNNELTSITATGEGSEVSIGKIKMTDIKGGTYNIHTGTKAGNVTAEDKGKIKLGEIDISDTDGTFNVNKDINGGFNNNLEDVHANGQNSEVNVGNVKISSVDGEVTIETGNSATGKLEALTGGKIHMGNVTFTESKGVTAEMIKTINRANGGILAEENGVVNMGTINITGVDGGTTNITTDNTATGLLHAKDGGSEINLGRVDIGQNGKIDNVDLTVLTTNEVAGIEALNGGVVDVGRVDLSNIKGGKVSVTTNNTVDGTITADGGGSKVSIGSTIMK